MGRLGWLSIATFGLLAGCQTLMPSSRVVPLDDGAGYVVMHRAEGRSAYIIDRTRAGETTRFVCAEPSPDVAQKTNLTINGKASTPTQGAAEASGGQAVASFNLGGRSESVLLARDMLFYTCLYGANGSFSDEQVYAAFRRTAELVAEITEVERGKSAARFVESATAASIPNAQISETLASLTARAPTMMVTTTKPDRHDVQVILCRDTLANRAVAEKIRLAADGAGLGWLALNVEPEVTGHAGFHQPGVSFYADPADDERAVADDLARRLAADGQNATVRANIGGSRWMVSASVCLP